MVRLDYDSEGNVRTISLDDDPYGDLEKWDANFEFGDEPKESDLR
jgi:hypothetical protein